MLSEVKQEVLTADGSAMKVEGSISISFIMSNMKFSQLFTVIDVGIDGILGLDFLTSNNCALDLPNSAMVVRGKRVKLSFEGKIGCCRVTVADNITIPPGSEVVTRCNIVAPVYEKIPELGVIESSDRFLESDCGLVARALVKGSNVTQVRLINLATEAMCLYKGTFVATLSAVDAVYEKSNYVRKILGLPDHLQDLYQRSTKGLDQENAKVVKQLLMKYSNLFAATDADLGRTKVTEHTI